MYFDKELVSLRDDAVFVDVGAYTGDTLNEFIDVYNKNYSRIICIEPNLNNVKALEGMIKEKGLENVDIYRIGASDKKQTLLFDVTSGIASRASKTGTEKVECNTLDSICMQEKYKHIDMIKMDIEGAEFGALNGAKKTIEKYHPILAICVYHKEDDFYKLTQCIKALYSGYRLYFRQYELSAEETVCYAIP